MYFFVLKDEQGFITQISKQEQASDDKHKWIRVLVPLTDSASFVKYFDKFRVDSNNVLLYPNNLPKEDSVEDMKQTIDKQSEQIKTLQQTVTDLTSQLIGGNL